MVGRSGVTEPAAVRSKTLSCQGVALCQEAGRIAVQEAKMVRSSSVSAGSSSSGAPEPAETAAALCASAAVSGGREACRHIALDIRDLASRLGREQKCILQETIAASEAAPKRAADALVVTTGKPLSMFDPASWPSCFVEFFYGDAVPNLERETKLRFEDVWRALLDREELEYHLPGDQDHLPGGVYRARSRSRFDTPEFVAVFADVTRRLSTISNVRAAFRFKGFGKDLRTIANASAASFTQASAILSPYAGSLVDAQTNEKVNPEVRLALKRLLLATGSTPLTEGYKMRLRHIGHAMNLIWGPLQLFTTCNFADTYSPLVLQLAEGHEGGPDVSRAVDLFTQEPDMPCLRDMHRLVARSPRSQAKFFLLMDHLVSRCLLGMRVNIGRVLDGSRLSCEEDDFASTAEPGLAGFAVASLAPLEAQGRGFSHAHRKVHAVPYYKAAELRRH